MDYKRNTVLNLIIIAFLIVAWFTIENVIEQQSSSIIINNQNNQTNNIKK